MAQATNEAVKSVAKRAVSWRQRAGRGEEGGQGKGSGGQGRGGGGSGVGGGSGAMESKSIPSHQLR